MKKKRMWETTVKFVIVFVLLGFCSILVLVGEWLYAEIRFQIWLRQDEHRLDFSAYNDPEELKKSLLTKLPLGSSEEAVQAFRMAHGWPYRPPMDSKYGPYGVGMTEYRAGRGLFGLRGFLFTSDNIWAIEFDLDPTNHTLVDIQVWLQSGK
jgi:hypothetical protein